MENAEPRPTVVLKDHKCCALTTLTNLKKLKLNYMMRNSSQMILITNSTAMTTAANLMKLTAMEDATLKLPSLKKVVVRLLSMTVLLMMKILFIKMTRL